MAVRAARQKSNRKHLIPHNRVVLTVLFSSAGRRVELINCFRSDAAALGLPLKVLAVDLYPGLSPACQVADQSFQVPRCTDSSFVPCLLEICAKSNVGLVIPTIDTELLTLATNRERFRSVGTRIAVSSEQVVRMCRDKLATTKFLEELGIPVPRTRRADDFFSSLDTWQWPVILKPIDGSSSVGVQVVEAASQIPQLGDKAARFIAQEFWRGEEYTVNLFFNSSGIMCCAVPHLRREVRAGEVIKARTSRQPAMMEFARKLGRDLKGASGALCFQGIVTPEGRAMLFEINARFGGGYPVAHRAGAPFSRWLLEELAGLPVSANDDWLEGVQMLRYDAAIFIE